MDLNSKRYLEKPLVTKQGILEYIQDIDVYKKYMDGKDVELRGGLHSPLREDNNPSFGFFIGKDGEVCFKDFVKGSGDFVKFVQIKFNIDFIQALSKIIVDFNIQDNFVYKKYDNVVNKTTYNKQDRTNLVKNGNPVRLNKRSRDWRMYDVKFWSDFGITRKTLDKYYVKPIDYIFINDQIIKADKYAYCFTEYKDGLETFKIYQPFNEKYKWLNNHDYSTWQGWEQLPESGSHLIITKSLKDVMAITEVYGIPAVSLQAESVTPKTHIIEELKNRFFNVYLLYDNDFDKDENWGQIFAEKLSKEFDIENVFIPTIYKSKDFSDLIKNTNKEEAITILEQELNNILPF